MTQRSCVQCSARKKNGERCSRRTCKYSDKCFQHTKIDTGLQIKSSNINGAGQGLFATKDFKRNEKITSYGGTQVSLDTYRNNPSGYGFLITRNLILDASSTQSGWGRYANNCRNQNKQAGECRGNNAKIVGNTQRRTANIKATKNIKAGEEIFVPYSRGYWK